MKLVSHHRPNRIAARGFALFITAAFAVSLVGCTAAETEPTVEPTLSAPAILNDGELTVGVNLGSAPYAVDLDGNIVGLDADLAREVAAQMGLTPVFVAVAPDEIDAALAEGAVDVVLSAPTLTNGTAGSASTESTVVAAYESVGTAIFAASSAGTATVTLGAADLPVVAQTGSRGYWTALHRFGVDGVSAVDSAALALTAVVSGDARYAVVDSLVGGYAISQGSDISQVGWLTEPTERGIAIRAANTALVGEITRVMGSLRDAGWIDALMRRWLTPSLPESGASGEGTVSAP